MQRRGLLGWSSVFVIAWGLGIVGCRTQELAFSRGVANAKGEVVYDIWKMDDRGEGAERLTTSSEFDSHSPIWLAGDDGILFSSWMDTGLPKRRNQLYRMASDGSDVERLTDNAYDDMSADLHPESGRIVFSRDRLDGNAFDLWIRDREGSESAIVRGPEDTYDPAWSPDGRAVAFTRRVGSAVDVWVWDSGTGRSRALVATDRVERSPSWSPDGEQIAFEAWDGEDFEIFVVEADGSGEARNLTDHPGHDASPAWSPRGGAIAFSSDRGGTFDVWIIPDTGGDAVQLTRSADDDLDPAWKR